MGRERVLRTKQHFTQTHIASNQQQIRALYPKAGDYTLKQKKITHSKNQETKSVMLVPRARLSYTKRLDKYQNRNVQRDTNILHFIALVTGLR
jgi:hypothetical protein